MLEYDTLVQKETFENIIETLKLYHPDSDIEMVEHAYEIACEAHKDQKRLSGEPFIIHPIEVAGILAKNRLDAHCITAALLHDVVEDTETGIDFLKNNFGEEIANLVDGVTKISSLKSKTKSHEQAQTLRKMLLATIDDPRVIIIKLADKTHNMRTLDFQPPHKQKRIAQEVMDIYAPLASRFGMSKIRSELEDLAFYTLHKRDFNEIKSKLAEHQNELDEYIAGISSILNKHLQEAEIDAKILGRIKHFYSIYKKMVHQNKPFEEIFDIRAIRIITNEVKDCYAVLGIVHTVWQPIPSRFKDYIALPKSNMYQSLHTTVMGPGKQFLEIQIRTEQMNETAEMGIAAHWMYKEKGGNKPKERLKDITLLKNINKWRSELKDTREFMKVLKMDLYSDEIFVFTPKGKIVKLARGATPVDFAYAIHSEVGHHCSGSKINHKIQPLKTKLKNGDLVEIITSKSKTPSESWLKFVRSSNARYKIRSWIKKQKALEQQSSVDESTRKEYPKTSQKMATFAINEEDLPKIQLPPKSKPDETDIIVANNMDVPIRLAQCCQPIPGDEVVGFISKGKKISVHKKDCPALQRLNIEKDRFISINWSESHHLHPVKIEILSIDRPNLLADITYQIANNKINIIKMDTNESDKEGYFRTRFIVEVKSVDHLQIVLDKLKQVKDVVDAYKVNEKVVRRQ
jgi:guanosine-3',5'-bis(diphosphate) 3'-pyrophosphohydrolase